MEGGASDRTGPRENEISIVTMSAAGSLSNVNVLVPDRSSEVSDVDRSLELRTPCIGIAIR